MEPSKRRRRLILWILAVLALALPVALMILSRGWLSPLAKVEVERALEQKYHRDLQLGSLEVSLFPHFRVVGTAVSLDHKNRPEGLPLIQMQRFVAETSWMSLLRSPRRIRVVRVEGLQIHILHKPDRKQHEHVDIPPTEPKRDPFIIQEVVADGAQLRIYPKKAGKLPLVFDIHKLTLDSVGKHSPMHYTAKLRNAKPPGIIDAKGDFGPWNTDDAGMTPVTGEYVFKDADLSAFKGMSGKLSSTGEFHGVLEKIEVSGKTDTPDFTISKAGHPVHLTTEFSATVDGVNGGDTLLHPVTAHFGQTTVRAQGGVVRHPGAKGKTVTLDAVIQNGSLADVMKLGVKAKPPLTGRISFRSKIVIPPEDRDIADKMNLSGVFDVQSGKFTSVETQKKITSLSRKAQGPAREDDAEVLTNLSGKFKLNERILDLAGLTFSVPGADIRLDGTYGLETEAIDMKGTATTQAKVSQMTTGVKSILLKAADPFFKKNGAGAVIPIKITGTRDQPAFGLRLRN